MRIEMAAAATPCNEFVEEFSTPITIIYGRPNSDRANYASAARREDIHLSAWLLRYAVNHPSKVGALARLGWRSASLMIRQATGTATPPQEAWVVRDKVQP
jgi:hypothetical protein